MIFPNPAGNEICLYSNEQLTGDIKMFTLTGQCVQDVKLNAGRTLDIRSLPDGCSVLKYIDGKRVCAKKIIVAH